MSKIDKPIAQFQKRMFDLVLGTVLIVVTLPIQILIAVLIVVTAFQNPIFVQIRAGKYNQPFYCIKFRTMRGKMKNAGENEQYRITKIGKWLRLIGLDELPQLWNVLYGTMSLVGPRPTFLYQTAKYTPYQFQRLKVKPGITGLAQIKGRNRLSWQERIEYDIEYIQKWSLWLDVWILLQTPFAMLRWKDAYGKEGKNDNFEV
ncbi:MAG: sugar transferase [Bacteroidia bacterium]|nr:sugar transferase [Bacteroidia bacterium]MDW8302774.1 sugar transferase [Bacteroidia bacterium]